jgi:hypothetical protein
MGVRAADHAECPSLASAAGSLLLAVRGAAPDLLVCRPELARRVLDAVAATAAEPGRTP